MKRKRRDSGRRKFEERCEASNCHRQQMRPASSESTSQAFSFGGRTDINRSGDENVILTSEGENDVCQTSFCLLHPTVAFDPRRHHLRSPLTTIMITEVRKFFKIFRRATCAKTPAASLLSSSPLPLSANTLTSTSTDDHTYADQMIR